MKERIEKWLEDRKEIVGHKWKEEFQYMLVLVLFWGFRGMIEERAKINLLVHDVEEAIGLNHT